MEICLLTSDSLYQDLHSFPTRRSSDLAGAEQQMHSHGTRVLPALLAHCGKRGDPRFLAIQPPHPRHLAPMPVRTVRTEFAVGQGHLEHECVGHSSSSRMAGTPTRRVPGSCSCHGIQFVAFPRVVLHLRQATTMLTLPPGPPWDRGMRCSRVA